MAKEELEKIAKDELLNLMKMEHDQSEWIESEQTNESPFSQFFDHALFINRVIAQPLFGPRSDERFLHWEIGLSWGGPSSILEIYENGGGRICVAWWSAPYVLPFDGMLRMLAEELSAYDDAMAGV